MIDIDGTLALNTQSGVMKSSSNQVEQFSAQSMPFDVSAHARVGLWCRQDDASGQPRWSRRLDPLFPIVRM
jgi:hypothetical protein